MRGPLVPEAAGATITVEIDFEGEGGFHWKGTVDQAGTVIETEFELKG